MFQIIGETGKKTVVRAEDVLWQRAEWRRSIKSAKKEVTTDVK